MNAFNRILTILFLAITAVAGAVTLISPALAIGGVQAAANLGREVLGEVGGGLRIVVRLAVAVLFLVFMGFLLWLELRRPNQRSVEVARANGGRIRLSADDVQERIAETVEAVAGIVSSKVRIEARQRGIAAFIEALTAPGLDPVAKGEEIAEASRAVVEDQLGLKMFAKPQVTVKVGKAKGVRMKDVTRRDKAEAMVPEPEPPRVPSDKITPNPGSSR